MPVHRFLIGIMEYWNDGKVDLKKDVNQFFSPRKAGVVYSLLLYNKSIVPIFQHSNIPAGTWVFDERGRLR